MPKESTKIIAGVVLRDVGGRYLLVQERKPQAFGLWNLPAGHMDPGETPERAAIREAFEEVGLAVKIMNKDPLHIEELPGRTLYAFSAIIHSGSLTIPEKELLDAKWLSFTEIGKLNGEGRIRSPWVINSIRKAEENAHTRD